MMKISNAVASSVGNGIADDALKDEDNGIWLVDQPSPVQAVWQERFYWIRWVDRLAEQEQIVQPGGAQFAAFYGAWQRLAAQGRLAAGDRHWVVLQQIEAAWFNPLAGTQHGAEIAAWDCYMAAIADYHQPQLTIATLQDYETMLDRLAGACFQLLPFLAEHHRVSARRFGMVDQFYNNLRDLYEDAQQGICYFPTELLAQFGLTPTDVVTLRCLTHPGFRPLMQFWVETYLPRLRQRHLTLMVAADLHPTWQGLTTWFAHRYHRIETIMQTCQYDFVAFADCYWATVRAELAQRHQQRQPSLAAPARSLVQHH